MPQRAKRDKEGIQASQLCRDEGGWNFPLFLQKRLSLKQRAKNKWIPGLTEIWAWLYDPLDFKEWLWTPSYPWERWELKWPWVLWATSHLHLAPIRGKLWRKSLHHLAVLYLSRQIWLPLLFYCYFFRMELFTNGLMPKLVIKPSSIKSCGWETFVVVWICRSFRTFSFAFHNPLNGWNKPSLSPWFSSLAQMGYL